MLRCRDRREAATGRWWPPEGVCCGVGVDGDDAVALHAGDACERGGARELAEGQASERAAHLETVLHGEVTWLGGPPMHGAYEGEGSTPRGVWSEEELRRRLAEARNLVRGRARRRTGGGEGGRR